MDDYHKFYYCAPPDEKQKCGQPPCHLVVLEISPIRETRMEKRNMKSKLGLLCEPFVTD